eukprot:EG_transcript_26597
MRERPPAGDLVLQVQAAEDVEQVLLRGGRGQPRDGPCRTHLRSIRPLWKSVLRLARGQTDDEVLHVLRELPAAPAEQAVHDALHRGLRMRRLSHDQQPLFQVHSQKVSRGDLWRLVCGEPHICCRPLGKATLLQTTKRVSKYFSLQKQIHIINYPLGNLGQCFTQA